MVSENIESAHPESNTLRNLWYTTVMKRGHSNIAKQLKLLDNENADYIGFSL